jgi:hypothetical protein
MFNGRLNKDEVDTWLDLLKRTSERGYRNRDLAKSFLQLDESITFVSSLEEKVIGGTSIYKDKTRLAMVLASVAVDKEFRETATYQIIKSSMPFFKTVAIRDVDALVPQDEELNHLGFPLSLELDPWLGDVINRIGFEEVATLEHCTFEIHTQAKESPIIWSDEYNPDHVRELIWDQSKPMGMTNSLVWLARDFARSSNKLVTFSINDELNAVAGHWKLSTTLCVSPLITNPKRVSWGIMAESLVAQATRYGLKRIDIPLIGEGQREIIRALEKWCDRSSCRKLSLQRKPL